MKKCLQGRVESIVHKNQKLDWEGECEGSYVI